MTLPEDEDIVLKLLHTADWHLGMTFGRFREEHQKKLTRARLEVVDRILHMADHFKVDAVLCAGDLFDVPDPTREWWDGLLKTLHKRAGWTRPVFLLPGNHDPLTPTSVYSDDHPFRRGLPGFVHVVDRDDFTYELGPDAVLHAIPCRSRAGQSDPTEKIPERAPGDQRIRIGLAHGTTFELDGQQMNFPIRRDAARLRGLDYLAVGDTHSFREVQTGPLHPTLYPSAPEPTRFGEDDSGFVAVVYFPRARGVRLRVEKQRVARWTWRSVTCRSLDELRALKAEDLVQTVLELTLALTVSLPEHEEVEAIVAELDGTAAAIGRAGVLVVDQAGLQLQASGAAFPTDLPDVLKTVVTQLEAQTDERARRALIHLFRLVKEGV